MFDRSMEEPSATDAGVDMESLELDVEEVELDHVADVLVKQQTVASTFPLLVYDDSIP